MISEAQAHKYCRDPLYMIEGYAEAINSSEKYEIHHRFGELAPGALLKKMGYYYGRPALELIFIKHKDHAVIHLGGKPKSDIAKARSSATHFGKILTEAHKAAIGAGVRAKLAEDPSIREKLSKVGLGRRHTQETKEKIRNAALNRSAEYSLHNSAAVSKAEHAEVLLYREYKEQGGPLRWSQWRHFHKIEKESLI